MGIKTPTQQRPAPLAPAGAAKIEQFLAQKLEAQPAEVAEVAQLEVEHNRTANYARQLQRMILAAQKSRDVLTAALQDESEFLADIQNLCQTGDRVHIHLVDQVLPALTSALQQA